MTTTRSPKRSNKTKAQLENELETLKNDIIQQTLQYPAGCEEGKKKFLQDIGLMEAPNLGGTFRITFEYCADNSDLERLSNEWGAPIDDAPSVIEMLENTETDIDNYSGNFGSVELISVEKVD